MGVTWRGVKVAVDRKVGRGKAQGRKGGGTVIPRCSKGDERRDEGLQVNAVRMLQDQAQASNHMAHEGPTRPNHFVRQQGRADVARQS